MCQGCQDNGPRSIAGVEINAYIMKIQSDKRFNIHLCHEIQASMLLSLQRYGATPATDVHSSILRHILLKDISLDFEFEYGLHDVIVDKLLNRAHALLKEALKWGAFIPVGDAYLWDNRVVITHFSCQQDVLSWMAEKRREAKSKYDSASPSTPQPRTPTRPSTHRRATYTPPRTPQRTNHPPSTPSRSRTRRALITTPSKPRRALPVTENQTPSRAKSHRRAISVDSSLTSSIWNVAYQDGARGVDAKRVESSSALMNFVRQLNIPGLRRAGGNGESVDIGVDPHAKLASLIEELQIDGVQSSEISSRNDGDVEMVGSLAPPLADRSTVLMERHVPAVHGSPRRLGYKENRQGMMHPPDRCHERHASTCTPPVDQHGTSADIVQGSTSNAGTKASTKRRKTVSFVITDDQRN